MIDWPFAPLAEFYHRFTKVNPLNPLGVRSARQQFLTSAMKRSKAANLIQAQIDKLAQLLLPKTKHG